MAENNSSAPLLPWPPAIDELPEAVIDAVAAALGDAYDCHRVWSAWSYGTMGPDDFGLVAEDGERIAEIARAAIEAYVAVTQAVEAQAAPAAVALRDLQSRLLAAANYIDVLGGDSKSYRAALAATPALPATEDSSAGDLAEPTDAEIIALNDGERFFSMSESRFGKDVNPHTQYHTGEPGYLQFARAVLARWGSAPQAQPAFQQRVQPWMMECFGVEHAADRKKRNQHFLEEALELVQSTGWTQSEAHQLVDYVYGRPWGEPAQEVGGVMVTLAALCLANGLDMHQAGESELARIWSNVDIIRARQAAKPSFSPLPQAQPADALDAARYRWLRDGNAYAPEEDHVRGGEDLDKLCDAAMAAAQEGGNAAKEA